MIKIGKAGTVSKVSILGYVYEIHWLDDPVSQNEHQKVVGDIDYLTQTIKVYADQHKQQALVTVWHEILHGIARTSGREEHSEALIDAFAHGLATLSFD